jgi:hypothetical protein
MTYDLNARVEEETAVYREVFGPEVAERVRPKLEEGIRSGLPPAIRLTEAQSRALDACRAERAERRRFVDEFIASERAAGVFDTLPGRGDDGDPGVLTPEEEAREHMAEAEIHNSVDLHLFGRVAAYAYHPNLPSWGDFAAEAEEAMREVVAGLNSRAYELEKERTPRHWDEGVYHEIRFGKGAESLAYAWSYGGLKEKTIQEAAAYAASHAPQTT